MSDLSNFFTLSAGVAADGAGTQYVVVPVDADLVSVTVAVDAAGANATTLDVSVGGTSIFATAADVVASGDAGASITANKLQIAGDSASTTATAKAKSSVRAGMTNEITTNVTSGVDFWTPVAPADAVLKSVTAGQTVKLDFNQGASAAATAATLVFVRK